MDVFAKEQPMSPQPHPIHSCPAQLGPAQPSPAQPGPAQPSPAQGWQTPRRWRVRIFQTKFQPALGLPWGVCAKLKRPMSQTFAIDVPRDATAFRNLTHTLLQKKKWLQKGPSVYWNPLTTGEIRSIAQFPTLQFFLFKAAPPLMPDPAESEVGGG